MTSNFKDFESDRSWVDPENNNSEADCFELLSAYIDGELTPSEKNKVQKWLDEDPEIKLIYTQLLKLQNRIQHSSAPPSNISTENLSLSVFQKIDRSEGRKRRLIWGGGAIAATLLATISGILSNTNSFGLRLAESSSQPTFSTPIMVAVAVNKPAVKIPKAAVAQPPKTTIPKTTITDN